MNSLDYLNGLILPVRLHNAYPICTHICPPHHLFVPKKLCLIELNLTNKQEPPSLTLLRNPY